MPRRAESIDRDIVEQLLSAAAPERKSELNALWQRYNPDFKIAEDGKNTHFNADAQRVQFDHKTLRLFWLLGFTGWKVLECYSPAVVCSVAASQPLDAIIAKDQGLSAVETQFEDCLYVAKSMVLAANADEVAWPSGIPMPLADRTSLADKQDRATFDLVCLATAYAFFHELRHVMFLQDRNMPLSRPDEEIACDAWAREFLTAKIGVYVQSSGEPLDAVLRKRSIGLALGVFILHEITPRLGHAGTDEYPPIADRIDALLHNTRLAENDHFWIFSAAVLVAVLRRRSKSPSIACSNARSLCERLIAEIRNTS